MLGQGRIGEDERQDPGGPGVGRMRALGLGPGEIGRRRGCRQAPPKVQLEEAPGVMLETGAQGARGVADGADGSQRERVNMMLVGAQENGTWVLTSLGMARETLTADEAATINDALAALVESIEGTYDPANHFADLRRH